MTETLHIVFSPDWYAKWHLLSLLNLGLCVGIAAICLCRISLMSSKSTCKPVRAGYVLCMAIAIAVGTLPLWTIYWPDLGEVLLASALFGLLLGTSPSWRPGPPPSSCSHPPGPTK